MLTSPASAPIPAFVHGPSGSLEAIAAVDDEDDRARGDE